MGDGGNKPPTNHRIFKKLLLAAYTITSKTRTIRILFEVIQMKRYLLSNFAYSQVCSPFES